MELKLTKYDPSVDAMPYQVTVNIDWYKNMTLLEAIQFAHEQTPISFDYNCRARQCGRCAVLYDDVSVMACCTFIESDKPHVIKPLPGFTILRDLIVDKKAAHDEMTRLYNRIIHPELQAAMDSPQGVTNEFVNNNFNIQFIEQIEAIEWCARCMVCTSACPAYKANPSKFIGPAAMLAYAYRYYDKHDGADRIKDAVERGGLWNCIMCGQCDHVCPQKEMKKVKQIWKDLRDAATAAGYKNPYA